MAGNPSNGSPELRGHASSAHFVIHEEIDGKQDTCTAIRQASLVSLQPHLQHKPTLDID